MEPDYFGRYRAMMAEDMANDKGKDGKQRRYGPWWGRSTGLRTKGGGLFKYMFAKREKDRLAREQAQVANRDANFASDGVVNTSTPYIATNTDYRYETPVRAGLGGLMRHLRARQAERSNPTTPPANVQQPPVQDASGALNGMLSRLRQQKGVKLPSKPDQGLGRLASPNSRRGSFKGFMAPKRRPNDLRRMMTSRFGFAKGGSVRYQNYSDDQIDELFPPVPMAKGGKIAKALEKLMGKTERRSGDPDSRSKGAEDRRRQELHDVIMERLYTRGYTPEQEAELLRLNRGLGEEIPEVLPEDDIYLRRKGEALQTEELGPEQLEMEMAKGGKVLKAMENLKNMDPTPQASDGKRSYPL